MSKYAMVSARALAAMPSFIEAQAGVRGLELASAAAGLPLGIERDDSRFITQNSAMILLDQGARLVGDDRLGLVLAPHLTPKDYGIWGDYVLSAPTLRDALRRVQRALPWHSTQDEVIVDRSGELVRFAYHVASNGAPLYENLAYCTVGAMINLIRVYLGPNWQPERIEFDLPRAQSMTRVHDSFGCEVRAGGTHVSVLMRPDVLATPRLRGLSSPLVTLDDVRRSRVGGAAVSLPDIVRELVQVQWSEVSVSLDAIAERLGLGPRTLQRQLESHGLRFREIVSQVRLDRARALLAEEDFSITWIANELGYSAPAHFARAFRRQTGLSPRRYRKVILESEE